MDPEPSFQPLVVRRAFETIIFDMKLDSLTHYVHHLRTLISTATGGPSVII